MTRRLPRRTAILFFRILQSMHVIGCRAAGTRERKRVSYSLGGEASLAVNMIRGKWQRTRPAEPFTSTTNSSRFKATSFPIVAKFRPAIRISVNRSLKKVKGTDRCRRARPRPRRQLSAPSACPQTHRSPRRCKARKTPRRCARPRLCR